MLLTQDEALKNRMHSGRRSKTMEDRTGNIDNYVLADTNAHIADGDGVRVSETRARENNRPATKWLEFIETHDLGLPQTFEELTECGKVDVTYLRGKGHIIDYIAIPLERMRRCWSAGRCKGVDLATKAMTTEQ